MHVPVENYGDAKILCKLNAHCFFVMTAMKLTIRLKQFINNLCNFMMDIPWCIDQMHFTYVDQQI